ncbi:hypothetical protein GGF32_001191 [Allomyces javanicus]|nr:hypothetical protein GGF32_001191 [Allomyces javanicus]
MTKLARKPIGEHLLARDARILVTVEPNDIVFPGEINRALGRARNMPLAWLEDVDLAVYGVHYRDVTRYVCRECWKPSLERRECCGTEASMP